MIPRLVLVAGAPGTGKTTLATRLGDLMPAPVLLKDAIKEGISMTAGARATFGGVIAERTFSALYACAEILLRHGSSVVVEAAFHRDWFAQEVARFSGLSEIRLVICHVPAELAMTRYRQRAMSGDVRRTAHPDEMVIEQMDAGRFLWSAYDVEGIVPNLTTLLVDTTTGYDPKIDEVVSFARN